jgi:hypothetical protein
MAASILLGKASLPRTVWSVAAPLLELEWTNNIVTVEDEATRSIKSIGTQLDLLLNAADLLVPGHGLQIQNFTALGLPGQLRMLGEQVLQEAIPLQRDDPCKLRATDRVAAAKPPARTAKNSYKDCEILEYYLELTRRLRAENYTHRCVIVTSNINDYCEVGSRLHPDLEKEFAPIQLEFITNIADALGSLHLL